MKLIIHKSLDTLETTYTLTITYSDTGKAKISSYDQILFDNCNREKATISDRLLALELLVRRIEEGNG